jgi:hypothetical protein
MNLWEKSSLFKSKTERYLERLKLSKRPTPSLPQKITKTQARILQAAVERGEVVGGSFAQKTLFPKSRKFQDIDIISKDPRSTAEYIQSKVTIPTETFVGRHGKYTIKHKASGKVLADIVPSKFYDKYSKETGQIPHYDIGGVKVLKEDVLYREKLSAIKYGNPKLREKVLKDVRFLSEA